MKPLKVKQKLLLLGWQYVRKNGSHLLFKKHQEMIALPEHQGKEVSRELLRSMAKKNNMTLNQFKAF